MTFYLDGPAVPDGDGGYTTPPVLLDQPTRYAEVKTATTRDLERLTAGTVISTESLLITMDFHPDVTTKTKATWLDMSGRSHTANVTSVNNIDQKCIDHVLVAVEIVQ